MKKIKLLFIYPNAVLQNPPPVSIALFYAILKDNPNLEIKLFDTTLYDTEQQTSDKTKEENLQVRPFNFNERNVQLKNSDLYDDLCKTVENYNPDLIALSCNEITFSLGVSLLKKISFHRSLKVVGGVFPTFSPEKVLSFDFIDAVCIGEGENVLKELIDCMVKEKPLFKIKNLWIKKENKIIKNKLRELVDINELPLPDYNIFKVQRYYRPMAGKIWKLFPIETSRGCPYQCSFCNSPSQRRMYEKQGIKKYFRKKTIENIDREISYLIEKYQAEYIYFLSDTLLCVSDKEFDKFCDMYKKYSLPFWCQNRPEMITYERMKKLKEIGCHRMSIGVEHGNEEFRKTVLKKFSKNIQIINAFEILDRVGIPVSINNIIGFPYETRELAFDTINLNRKLKFDTSNAYAFTPFHGTELYDICLKEGYILSDYKLDCFTKGSFLNMPQFSKDEINGLIKTFSLYAKMPEKYLDEINLAESDTIEGKQKFSELSEIYRNMFFK
jgi:radical SAM superfamily enzyme YgiQ (UPF0313 family)